MSDDDRLRAIERIYMSSTDQLEFYAVLPQNSAASTAMSNAAVTNGGASNLVGTIDPTFYAGVCRVDILVRQLPTDVQPVLVKRVLAYLGLFDEVYNRLVINSE